jgi:hypothetical protein
MKQMSFSRIPIALVIMAGIVTVSVARPSSAALTASPYRANGNLDFVSINPGPPDSLRGTVELTPIRARGDQVALGPAPARGTVNLTAAVRRPVQPSNVPPNPCLELVATGTMTIAWQDGSSFSGNITMIMVSRTVTLHGNLTGGRFNGGVLTIVASLMITPGPPDCDASISGTGGLVDAA